MTEPEFIQAMSVLTVQPGDIIVLKTDLMLSAEQNKWLTDHCQKIVGAPVMVLHGGLDIGVLRQAA